MAVTDGLKFGRITIMNVKSIERNGNQTTITVEIDKELMESGVQKAYMKSQRRR